MDFEIHLSPELEAFRKEVAEFLEQNVPKNMELVSPYGEDYPEQQYQIRRELGRKLGAKGWLAPTYPREYGGGGLTIDHAMVISDELYKYHLTSPPFYDSGISLSGPSILVWGTPEQKQHFLPPMFKGEVASWQLLTEPQGGTDLASTRTAAVRDGDEYVINGQKTFVGDQHKPDQLWTIVLTDPNGPRHQNVSWIMVPGDLPGITIQPLDLLSANPGVGGDGMPHTLKNTVFFDNVRVPAFNLIGGENNGWKVASTHLELEHGGGGSLRRNRVLEEMLEYCKETQFNGRPLIEDPDIRDILAEAWVEGEVKRLFGLRNYWLAHARQPRSYEGPQSSVWGRVSSRNFALQSQRVLGHYAVTRDRKYAPANGHIEAWNRDFFSNVHAGGSLNIMKLIAARRMGAGRTAKEAAGELPD